MSTHAQISFEYLIIIGIAIVIIIPGIIFFLSYSQTSNDSSTHSRVNDIGREMIDTAADVYALGKNSWLTLDVNMPDAIDKVWITNQNELVISYFTQYGTVEAVFYPPVVTLVNVTDRYARTTAKNLTVATGRPGIMRFKFVSLGANVSIEEAQ